MGAQNGAKKTETSEQVIDVEKNVSPKKTVKKESVLKGSPLNKNSKKTKNTKLTSDDEDQALGQENDVLVDEKENNLASCYLKNRLLVSYLIETYSFYFGGF
jgi:hypothetical protein